MLQQIHERLALQEAIGQLYSVFAPYPLRRVVEGCPHCVSVADEKRLHEAPLRALTEEVSVPVEVAGEALGIGRNSAYSAIKSGEIPSVRIGRRIAVPTAAIRKMLQIEEPSRA